MIADCQAWEKQFGSNPQLGEVLALLGDAYAASDREAAAIPVYIRSYQTATTDEVMNYSLTAASKLLQKRGEWDKVRELYTGFVKDKPDNPTVISRALLDRQSESARGKNRRSQAARRRHDQEIHRRSEIAEAVEQLITQLAQLCVKKKKPRAGTLTPRSGLSQRTGAAAGYDRDGRSGRRTRSPAFLGRDRAIRPPPKRASFSPRPSSAGCAGSPRKRRKILAEIASQFKPEDLSPLLLGRGGRLSLGQGKLDQAATFYQQLLDEFPKSQMIDYAYNGLGEIAYQKKDYPKALQVFQRRHWRRSRPRKS